MSSIRWFYVLIAAIAVAGVTLTLQRLLHLSKHNPYVVSIAGAALIVVFVALSAFLAKFRD